MNNSNNATAREAYNRARQILFDAWIESFKGDATACWKYVNERKLSQHTLRLEVALTAAGTNFAFAVTPNVANSSNVVFPSENRLQMQDTLIASEYAVMIGQTTGATDLNWQPRTYANAASTGADFFAAADITLLNNLFYGSGSLRWTCNNDVIAPYRPLRQNYYAAQTQQTGALGAASPQDQFRGAEDGFITMEPNIYLIGSKGYIPELVLKTAMTGLTANIRAVLFLNGILAQNSTSVS